MRFLARLVVNGVAIVIGAFVVPGLELTGFGVLISPSEQRP